ncbi:hypothetical protein C8F04DRAFT_1128586 [Mycena alexandri]|uniref:Uncharacterized protein n=1 Tax=Mycena alexandri TaxID=1745969 RepID=A0AAD6WUJ1_9AGAR|nr:hypothetical protein C8F04DRAFT_1128586 [Mycena alexandri]
MHLPTLSSAFAFFLASLASTLATVPAILHPADGTPIPPGASFPFEYLSIADYGTSSHNYSVYLLTSPPAAFAPLRHSRAGITSNYPVAFNYLTFKERYPSDGTGNPNPTNRASSQLAILNFSLPPDGFGAGAFAANNSTVYPVSFQVFNHRQGVIGNRTSFTANRIIHNATTH